jgi:predicted CxxxxCH...CXXCH cytochrome family protein
LISGSGVITTPNSPTSTVTSLGGGANVFRWTISNPPCVDSWQEMTITVTVAGNPTITLGAFPTVCQGTTTANLPYSATTDSPDQYSIDYDAAAEAQGFVDVTLAALPASPIVLVVPGGAAAGVYSGDLTVKNSGTGLTSVAYPITVTVNADPTVAAAGPDQSIGVNFSTFAGNVPGIGTGTWTLISGSGSITTPNSATSNVTSLGGGANVFRWTISNPPCVDSWQEMTITVTVTPPPTITLGADPTVCQGITTANLTYSATTNSPDQYSIDYNPAAEAQGFVDVVNAALPASPIVHTVPGGAATGTYYGSLTVRNSGTGQSSISYGVSVTVITTPLQPLLIFGPATANENTPYTYTIASIPDATSYTWSVPGGWTIDAGQGTVSVDVTTGAANPPDNISVTATNSCGTSAARNLSVTVVVASDHTNVNCNACHIWHSSPGVNLTNTAGNALLCQSCHVAGGLANNKPLPDADKAIPGVSGNSHAWNVAAINAAREASTPLNAAMAIRLDAGNIVCSTCHDQHVGSIDNPHLRANNTGDAICKDCHSPRNVGIYTDAPATNKGSHPVGTTYNGGDSRFNAAPTNTQLVGGNVECSSCHGVHDVSGGTLTNDGYLLRMTNDANLCLDCHNYGQHNGMDCLVCHQVHNTNKSNIYMIRDVIATPSSGNKAVIFTSESGTNSFSDGDGTYNGICEVCHTGTSHHTNTNDGHNHNDGANCTGCHSHDNNFTPVGCHSCHEGPAYPQQYPLTGAHEKHAGEQYRFPCSTCHFEHGNGGAAEPTHSSGTVDVVFDPSGLAFPFGADAGLTPTWNSGTKTCSNVYCHSDGRNAVRGTDGIDTWGGTGSSPGTFATTPAWDVGSITDCYACHNGIGNMTSPFTITEPHFDTDPPSTGKHTSAAHTGNSQEWDGVISYASNSTQCFWCHNTNGGNGTGAVNQGTYGTYFHVDAQTYFKPRSVVDGGTMINAPGGGSFSYSKLGSATHCGQGKQCWP